ncbi:MAG TPA: putative toxin-antitoxin system toxin component, PIN family [Gemmatimonadaceae bacterium]|nr:putative toxin-antitoxin system toxin component, PIN family [Gemmatimonadaceae bacterium]
MPSEPRESDAPLIACLDANVFVSAIAFDGVPQQVVDRLLAGSFSHVTGENILMEVRRNLVEKLLLPGQQVDDVLDDIRMVSSIYVPRGKRKYIAHAKDNLVVEVALMGASTVLVSGDRKHLLPLSPLHGLVIEPPSAFPRRLR